MIKLKQLYSAGEYSDVNMYIEGHGLVAQPHRVILSLWSVPFAKVNNLSQFSAMCLLHILNSLSGMF